MADAFRNKIFIITGSARGLGRGFAEAVLKEGGRVTLSDVAEDVGQEAAAELAKAHGGERVHFVRCDVTVEEQFRALWDASEAFFKAPVDVLVNNAGVNHTYGWRKCMDININAVIFGCHLALERMGRSKGSGRGGLVVNTASRAGLLVRGHVGMSTYFASKHAVIGLTSSLGDQTVLDEEGVKFVCLCPAFTDTNIIQDEASGMYDAIVKAVGAHNIMPVSKVADAFVALVREGRNGAALCVMPRTMPFYWPYPNLGLFIWLTMGVALATKIVAYVKPDVAKHLDQRTFGVWHQMGLLVATLFLLWLLLKFLLCFACSIF